MDSSILNSVKKVLNLAEGYTHFDQDIILHINSVFSTLNQLGIGPEEGFMIEDDTSTWSDLLGDDLRLNNIKTYVYLEVRMLFDPPTIGFVITAMEKQIAELKWRISVQRESVAWTDPDGLLDSGTVIDGGTP